MYSFNSNCMTNSVDSDQIASSEAIWSGFTLFAMVRVVLFSRIRVNVRVCCCSRWRKWVFYYFFCSWTVPFSSHSPLFLFFIFYTGSSVPFLPFNRRWHETDPQGLIFIKLYLKQLHAYSWGKALSNVKQKSLQKDEEFRSSIQFINDPVH